MLFSAFMSETVMGMNIIVMLITANFAFSNCTIRRMSTSRRTAEY